MQKVFTFPEICQIITDWDWRGHVFNGNDIRKFISLIDQKLTMFFQAERNRHDRSLNWNDWQRFSPEVIDAMYQFYHNICQRIIIDPERFKSPLMTDDAQDTFLNYHKGNIGWFFSDISMYVLGISEFSDDFVSDGDGSTWDTINDLYRTSFGELKWLRRKAKPDNILAAIKRHHIENSQIINFLTDDQYGGYLYAMYRGYQIYENDTRQLTPYLRKIKCTSKKDIVKQASSIITKFSIYRIIMDDFAFAFFDTLLGYIPKADITELIELFDDFCAKLDYSASKSLKIQEDMRRDSKNDIMDE